MRLLRDVALFAALGWLLLVALTNARAQEPTPTPVSPCAGIEFEGGSPVTINFVQITAPQGDYTRTIPAPGTEGLPFSVCHVATGASVVISSETCEEVSRDAGADGDAILDAIVASCQVIPASTPEPTPVFACAEGTPVSGGRPLDIEDAIQVTLPEGQYLFYVRDGVANFCNPEEEYILTVNLSDCLSPTILPPGDPRLAIQRQVSCLQLRPPTTGPFVPPANITPPHTGDAGQRN